MACGAGDHGEDDVVDGAIESSLQVFDDFEIELTPLDAPLPTDGLVEGGFRWWCYSAGEG